MMRPNKEDAHDRGGEADLPSGKGCVVAAGGDAGVGNLMKGHGIELASA